MKNKKRRGFTLVELLVVLLILGVLVGLAVPRYMQSRKTARARTFAGNVREIVSALEAYSMDHTTGATVGYPSDLTALRGTYFTQEPINPYTGVSMLTASSSTSASTDAGITYTPTNNNLDYILKVIQNNVDNLPTSTGETVGTATSLCVVIPEMLPTQACTPEEGEGG